MRGLLLMFALLSLRAVAQKTEPDGADFLQPIQKVDAEYSDEGRVAGLEGTVPIMGTISEDGTPSDLHVTQPLGLGLDQKALEAVKQWRYPPSAHQLAYQRFLVDFLLPAKQSRWHLTRVLFEPPEGVSRPIFLSAKYPLGSGIALAAGDTAIDEARIVAAVGRQAWAVVSFDVDENGLPHNFDVPDASVEVWRNQAIALVREWRFVPGMKDGRQIAVHCTLNLVWGQRNLSPVQLAQARPGRQEAHSPALNLPFPRPAAGVARIEVSASAQSDRLIQSPAPKFPASAWQAGLGGVVLFELLIGTDGRVQQAVAVNRTSEFIPEAVNALMQWIYQPATLNGKPAEVTTLVPIEVPLQKGPAN